MPWKLYRVQDPDRPAFVVAKDYQDAVNRWQQNLAKESGETDPSVVGQPSGVEFLTDYAELVLPANGKDQGEALDAKKGEDEVGSPGLWSVGFNPTPLPTEELVSKLCPDHDGLAVDATERVLVKGYFRCHVCKRTWLCSRWGK